MKKWMLATMLIIVCLLTACGASKESPQKAAAEISIDEVFDKIMAVNPVADARTIDDFALENEMGLNPENIEAYKGVITNSQNDCSLIFVAKAKDGKARDVKKELSDYLTGLSANDLYVEFADKIEKTKQARPLIFDDYVVLSIAGLQVDNDAVVKAINEAFGES